MEPDRETGRAFYRPRRPQETPLYQVLDRHFDELKTTYEDRFERRYGPWRTLWEDVVCKYLDCGVHERGFARVRCPGCRTELLVAFSCKNRICPTCEQKRMLLFAEKTTEEILLAVPHRFWTFSIPKAIRGIMLRDRRLLKLIPKCAFEAVKQAMKEAVARDAAECGTPGAVLAIHTAGNLLQWNPHVHGIVTEGFFDRDGRFIHLPDLDPKFVEILFGELLLKELLKKERISPGLVSSMATWRHSGFSTHSKPAPSNPDDPAFFHMLRYMKRPAVAISRIALDPNLGKVVYTADFNPMLGTDRIEVDPLEFTAKVLIHVPDKNSRRVIGYGVYSNRALGERRKKARGGEESACVGAKVSAYEPMTEADEFAKKRRQSWARLIQKVWEISPMTCPRCGGEMRVVAVITDPAVIDEILRHIEKKGRAPPEGEAAA